MIETMGLRRHGQRLNRSWTVGELRRQSGDLGALVMQLFNWGPGLSFLS